MKIFRNPKHLPSFFALLLILFGGSFLYFMAPERPPEMKFYTSTISYDSQKEVSLDFTDISSTDWFYPYLQTLVSEGVIDNAAAPFRPDDSLNRAELVKIVIGLLGEPILSPATPSFQDVSSGSWYFGYVETAVSLGIVEGYRDADGVLTGYFGPADTVNRAQAVKIFIKAFSLEGSAGSSTFPDVSASAWYASYVSAAANLGIVSGYENGNFGPGDSVTRAQITKIAVKSEEAGGGGVVVDEDGDGFSTDDGDCDDLNASVYPGATEICDDGVDQDCTPGDLPCDPVDNDGDGYTETAGDCNDASAAISPKGTETCGDGVDQDCSGADLVCSDLDNDKDGYSTTEGDCNDADASIYPGVSEKCDSIDNDCDGQKDEGLSTDSDKDGYTTKTSCEGTKNDCDDSKASVYVGATETCGDGIDQDCSEADLTCSKTDNDKDGYSTAEGDCNDSNAGIYPGATETCGDGIDQNCSGKDLPCATANPCDSIEGINEDVCSGYYTASEEYVCACPVAKASASEPFCEIPSNKSSAQLYFTSSYSNDLYQYKKLGTKYIPYHQYFGSVSFNGSGISYEETGRMDTFLGSCSDSAKENCPYYSWVEAVPSPSDAAFLALYEQADNLLSDGNSANDDDVSGIDKKARYAGIAGCASGSNPGFRLDHFLQNLTAPLVRWGSKTGTEREMYAMVSDMYRFLFAPSIQSVTQTGSGSAIDAMVVKSSTLLGRTSSASTAFADFDITFQSGKDTYAVFLESLLPSEGIYDYSNELAITRINLMDLNNCDFSRCTGDSSVKFCCKTAVLIESTLDFWPTNPALSDNGELISFNRFGVSLGMFGDPYSQYYVMKNPFKNSTLLGSCLTSDGQDGFGKPIDCTPLISKSDGTFDYNECPNYSCCGSSGVNCSTCVSVGRNNYDGVTDSSGTVICDDNSDALRSLNWVVFLKQSSNDYVTYFSKTAGNAIDEDFYKIRVSGDQFVLDTLGVVPLTRISITDFEVMPGVTFQDFLLAPFRK